MLQGEDGVARREESLLRDLARMAQMGSGPLAKLKIFLVALIMMRLGWPARRRVRISVRAIGRRVRFLVSTMSDLLVLRDAFFYEDYRYDVGKPKTIIDLGSNIGSSVIYFRLKYPQARIIGVEPDPQAFAKLERNSAPFDGIELRNVAIAREAGQATLHSHDQSWGSSFFEWWPGATAVQVPAQTLDDLVRELEVESIDLLKMDIEGAEFEVLPSFKQLDKVRVMVGEIHAYLSDVPVPKLLESLSDFRVEAQHEGRYHVPFTATRETT